MADQEHHVVLEFDRSPWRKLDKKPIISTLTDSLPDHSVFDSGGDERTEWITVTPVISQARILSQLDQIKHALATYTEACATLIAQRKSGTLSPDWTEDEHGGDVCFQNKTTGQTVEAPLCGAPTLNKVDPYFFTVFVKTTGKFPAVADLIHDDFHDSRRILDVVINPKGPTNEFTPIRSSAAELLKGDS